jgi:phage shock protein A
MVQIGDATTGLGRGLSEAGRAIERARDKTEQMQARAAALDELVASGTLTDQLAPGQTQLDRELAELSRSANVQAELERIKREVGVGGPRSELTTEAEA